MGEEPSISSSLLEKMKIAENLILSSQSVRIVSHYDADGITSTAILCTMLLRKGKGFHASIVKELDAKMFSVLSSEENTLTIFSDMGSGQIEG
jgi:RecJ-like exonuclease